MAAEDNMWRGLGMDASGGRMYRPRGDPPAFPSPPEQALGTGVGVRAATATVPGEDPIGVEKRADDDLDPERPGVHHRGRDPLVARSGERRTGLGNAWPAEACRRSGEGSRSEYAGGVPGVYRCVCVCVRGAAQISVADRCARVQVRTGFL